MRPRRNRSRSSWRSARTRRTSSRSAATRARVAAISGRWRSLRTGSRSDTTGSTRFGGYTRGVLGAGRGGRGGRPDRGRPAGHGRHGPDALAAPSRRSCGPRAALDGLARRAPVPPDVPTAGEVASGPPPAEPDETCSRARHSSASMMARPPITPGSAERPRSRATTSCSISSSSGRSRTCGSWSTTAPARSSATWPPACRGSRRCSGATRSSRAPGDRLPAAAGRRDADRAGRLPGDRDRRLAGRGARQDPPRAADRGDGPDRGTAAHAVLRLGRLDAAVADPARRDVRLDRRPGPRRPAVAERPGRSRVDRPLRRPRRRRVRGVRPPTVRARPAQPGLEGFERRDPGSRRDRGRAAHRARRGPGLRVRRQAPDGRPRSGPRRSDPGDPP